MKKPLIIIDSGIGGATVLKEILKTKNFSRIIYLADQKYFPYGEKSHNWLNDRIKNLISWSLAQDPCCIVLACNSATSQAIKEAREQTKVPIVGVEPVIKPLSKYKSSLLLGTKAALSSSRTKELAIKHNPPQMITHSPSRLASAIEEMDDIKIRAQIKQIAENTNQIPQAIGLSCTHYPLVAKEFKRVFPQSDIVAPSEAVVRRINSVCPHEGESPSTIIDLYTTGEVIRLKKQLKKYLDLELDPKEVTI